MQDVVGSRGQDHRKLGAVPATLPWCCGLRNDEAPRRERLVRGRRSAIRVVVGADRPTRWMFQRCARRHRLHHQHRSAHQGGDPKHRGDAYHASRGFATRAGPTSSPALAFELGARLGDVRCVARRGRLAHAGTSMSVARRDSMASWIRRSRPGAQDTAVAWQHGPAATSHAPEHQVCALLQCRSS